LSAAKGATSSGGKDDVADAQSGEEGLTERTDVDDVAGLVEALQVGLWRAVVAKLGIVVIFDDPRIGPWQSLYLYGSQYPGGRAINPAAFSVPATTFTQGDLQRNGVRGFDVWQEDIAVRREFPIKEGVSLLFRAEAFNVFNHPLIGDVGVNAGQNILTSGSTLDGVNIVSTTPNKTFGISTQSLASSLGGGGADGGFSSLYQIGAPRSMQFAVKLQF
jgi:hypothetical protein